MFADNVHAQIIDKVAATAAQELLEAKFGKSESVVKKLFSSPDELVEAYKKADAELQKAKYQIVQPPKFAPCKPVEFDDAEDPPIPPLFGGAPQQESP